MIDILIITALVDELEALKEVEEGLCDPWMRKKDKDGFTYFTTSFNGEHGILQIAAAAAVDMGGISAIETALRLLPELKPQCLAMCGICAGRRGDCSLGDVIVADKVFKYDTGKVKAYLDEKGERIEEFFADITTYQLKGQWKDAVGHFKKDWTPPIPRPKPLSSQGDWILDTLKNNESPLDKPERKTFAPAWAETLKYLEGKNYLEIPLNITEQGRSYINNLRTYHPDHLPQASPFQVHLAPIASGDQVVQDDSLFARRILKLVRKTLGLEMEAAAIFQVAANKEIPTFIAKGVSDHADEDEDDSFRNYAARASAEFVLAFLRAEWIPTGRPAGTGFFKSDKKEATEPPRLRSHLYHLVVKEVGEILDTKVMETVHEPLKKVLDVNDSGARKLAEHLGQGNLRDRIQNFGQAIKKAAEHARNNLELATWPFEPICESAISVIGWLVLLSVDEAWAEENEELFKDGAPKVRVKLAVKSSFGAGAAMAGLKKKAVIFSPRVTSDDSPGGAIYEMGHVLESGEFYELDVLELKKSLWAKFKPDEEVPFPFDESAIARLDERLRLLAGDEKYPIITVDLEKDHNTVNWEDVYGPITQDLPNLNILFINDGGPVIVFNEDRVNEALNYFWDFLRQVEGMIYKDRS